VLLDLLDFSHQLLQLAQLVPAIVLHALLQLQFVILVLQDIINLALDLAMLVLQDVVNVTLTLLCVILIIVHLDFSMLLRNYQQQQELSHLQSLLHGA